MADVDGLAIAIVAASPEGLSNEALQQTRPAFTSIGAVLAAERRCWADFLRVR